MVTLAEWVKRCVFTLSATLARLTSWNLIASSRISSLKGAEFGTCCFFVFAFSRSNLRCFRLWSRTFFLTFSRSRTLVRFDFDCRPGRFILCFYCSRLKKMVKTGPLECMELNRYCTVLIRHYLNEHTELYRIFQKLISS